VGAEFNKAVLARILKAYALADLAPLMGALHDDIAWTSNALPGHYRFGGRRQGRAGVIEALSMIASDYAIYRYDVRDLIGEGEIVWALCELEVGARGTQQSVALLLGSRWEFRDGKIISCQEFFDTAGTLAQLGRIQPTLADTLTA
jgi:ketosteroid isomerase-like protein